MSKQKKFWLWLPVVLYALVIFSSSAIPGQYVPELFPGSDKIFHFLEYLPFGFLIVRALSRSIHVSRLHSLLMTIFVVILFSLSDEFHQLFVPARQFDLVDAFFDLCGATIGSVLYRWQQ